MKKIMLIDPPSAAPPQRKTTSSKTAMRRMDPAADSVAVNGDVFKRQLVAMLSLLKQGDFSARLPSDLTGLDGKVADSLNEVAARMERYGESLFRLRNEVGRKGKISERLSVGDSVGGWAERIEAVNSL